MQWNSLEHILLSCEVIGQDQIWWLVRETWELRNPGTWPNMNNIGSIMRCALVNFQMPRWKPRPGDYYYYYYYYAHFIV